MSQVEQTLLIASLLLLFLFSFSLFVMLLPLKTAKVVSFLVDENAKYSSCVKLQPCVWAKAIHAWPLESNPETRRQPCSESEDNDDDDDADMSSKNLKTKVYFQTKCCLARFFLFLLLKCVVCMYFSPSYILCSSIYLVIHK